VRSSRAFRFDFTIGDERYKSEWADTTLNLYDHVSGVTARGWPLATLARTRRQLKRTIKQNPMCHGPHAADCIQATLGDAVLDSPPGMTSSQALAMTAARSRPARARSNFYPHSVA
jgi:CelD/BcsL family acetyltransferase involved in cellulose biosynthesis